MSGFETTPMNCNGSSKFSCCIVKVGTRFIVTRNHLSLSGYQIPWLEQTPGRPSVGQCQHLTNAIGDMHQLCIPQHARLLWRRVVDQRSAAHPCAWHCQQNERTARTVPVPPRAETRQAKLRQASQVRSLATPRRYSAGVLQQA
jgi:hypothetical protein